MNQTMTVVWKEGARFNVKAEEVFLTVERIVADEGICPPGRLVDEARPIESPLHPAFTWDDVIAAEKWRDQEARKLINAVRLIENDKVTTKPVFLHTVILDEEGAKEGYAPLRVIMQNKDQAAQAVYECGQQLKGLRRRYAHIKEYQQVWSAVDKVAV